MKHLAAIVLAVICLFGPARAQDRTLTLSAYGESPQAYQADLYDPFMRLCGCKLVVEVGNSAERLAKLEARKDNPVIDIAVMSDFAALDAWRRGLLQPIDRTKLDHFDRLYDQVKDPLGNGGGVGYTIYATSIVYRTDKLKDMTSWKDLWRPELAKNLALPDINTTQGPLALFMTDRAWGGNGGDMRIGFEKLAELAPNVVTFYQTSAQFVSMFTQEEIAATVVGRFAWKGLLKTGLPLTWMAPAEGQTGGMNVMVLTKGSKNADLAYQLMNLWLSAPVQEKLGNDLVDSPVNVDAKLTPEAAGMLTYGAEQVRSIHFLPPADILDHRAAWIEQWNHAVGH